MLLKESRCRIIRAKARKNQSRKIDRWTKKKVSQKKIKSSVWNHGTLFHWLADSYWQRTQTLSHTMTTRRDVWLDNKEQEVSSKKSESWYRLERMVLVRPSFSPGYHPSRGGGGILEPGCLLEDACRRRVVERHIKTRTWKGLMAKRRSERVREFTIERGNYCTFFFQ